MSLQQSITDFRGQFRGTVLEPGDTADYSSDAVLFVPTGPLRGPGLAWKPPVDSGTVGRSGTLRPAEVKSRS